MKKINSILAGLLLSASVFLTQQANAQAPQKMSYQSVIRNSSNALVANTAVGIQLSVLQGSASGTAVYVETQTATTNANGLVSLQIGNGTATTGTFAGIDWATGPYFIKTQTDPTGGSNYTITGTQQMASVPYALYAAKSGGMVFETTADDPTAIHNTNPGNVGIGTDLPSEKLDVSGNVRVRGTLGIGTQVPNASAALEINSTTGALLLPRMTTAERNNLNATEGMMIYNSTDLKYQGYSNTIVNADPVVDQSQLNFDNSLMNQDLSQSFTAGVSGTLSSVRVLLLSFGPQNATISIRSGAGNSGVLLYQTTVAVTYQDNGTWYIINPIAVSVTAGNTYTIHMTSSGFGPENVLWLTASNNPYAGGNSFIGTDPYEGYDLAFETTVTPAPAGSLEWININPAPGASNEALVATNNQVQTNTTNIAGLQSQLSTVQSNFVTTIDDPSAIHNVNQGNVGIGTDLPSEKLDVAGNVRIRGGNPAQGKVLTSDDTGAATWQTPVTPNLSGYATTTDLNATAAQLAVQNDLQSTQIATLNYGLVITNNKVQDLFILQSNQIATVNISLANTNNQVQGLVTQNAVQSDQITTLNTGLANTNDQVQYLADENAIQDRVLHTLHDIQSEQIATLNIGLANTNAQVQTNTTDITNLQTQVSTLQSNAVATTMGTIGASATTNGATITAGVLSLTPANATNGGVVTTAAQTFAGDKTFSGNVVTNGNVIISNPTVTFVNTSGTTLTAANILTGFIESNAIGSPASITLPSVASIAAALGGPGSGIGTSFEFTVSNNSASPLVLTLGAGMGVQSSPVIAGSNSLSILNGAIMGRFRLVFKTFTSAILFRIY